MKYFVLRTVDLYPTCSPNVPDHFTIGQIVKGEEADNAFICREGDSCKTYLIGNKELHTIFSLVKDDSFKELESLSLQRLSNKIPSMELRDLFAMNALNGLIANRNLYSIKESAKTAYDIADAMLKEREK